MKKHHGRIKWKGKSEGVSVVVQSSYFKIDKPGTCVYQGQKGKSTTKK